MMKLRLAAPAFLIDIAGNAIHLLLIVALAILIYNLLAGRRIG